EVSGFQDLLGTMNFFIRSVSSCRLTLWRVDLNTMSSRYHRYSVTTNSCPTPLSFEAMFHGILNPGGSFTSDAIVPTSENPHSSIARKVTRISLCVMVSAIPFIANLPLSEHLFAK